MRKKLVESAVNIGVFFVLFYGTFVLFPYVATSQKYEGSQNVSELFPIAVMENGHASIVKWHEYKNNSAAYIEKLISVSSKEEFLLGDHEKFTLEASGNNTLALSLYADDYKFWAEYSVSNGIVTHKSEI